MAPTAAPDDVADGRDRQHADGDDRVDADAAEDLLDGGAAEVGGERHARRPCGPAERVPDEEGAPAHRTGAGQPRGPDAQPGDPAAEEDGLWPVTLEERVAERDHALALLVEAARTLQQCAAAAAADLEADVVADDRAGRGDDDHEHDREATVRRREAAED